MKKKVYCDVCDKCISSKNIHSKTKTHKLLSLSIVKRVFIKNFQVKTIEFVIDKHIFDYNKKFIRFFCHCEFRTDNFFCKIDFGLFY